MIHNNLKIDPGQKLYDQSVIEHKDSTFFMIRDGLETCLIVHPAGEKQDSTEFEGEWKEIEGTRFLKCPLTVKNAAALRKKFPFTRPVLIGKNNSYGLGDRLGNAGPAHLKAIRKTEFKPVLAQQSIRELQRTGRTAQDVMDAASWAVFREGYKDGFGADGDHLKTTDDIDLMVKAGFTMFTIDPSDFVVNEAVEMDEKQLMEEIKKLPWDVLNSDFEEFSANWFDSEFTLTNDFSLKPSRKEILAGLVKYGRVISHTKTLADYIDKTYPEHPTELELSVDETDQPTTLFEHFLIASELNRLGVELVSLAPRFCGDFEKGVDFRGDLEQFKQEYLQHLAIARHFGGYKLSIHSGSDKFSVYEAVGSLNEGKVHVKTAGTSYLEALRTVAEADPDLFREILEFSKTRFANDKKTYHISGRPENVPEDEALKDHQLNELLDDDDARQVLHVTYGSVLSGDSSKSNNLKEKLMKCLAENEMLYERNLEKHFYRHLRSFN
jgi:tagaturonate epimerase